MDDLLCRVLTACRGELTGLFPGLGAAFSFLPWQEDRRLGTDGQTLFVPRTLVNAYGRNPARVRRGYLHILLHCLFLHIRIPDRVDPDLWGLACDIWVETYLDSLQEPRLTVGAGRSGEIAFSGGPWQIMEKLSDSGRNPEELKKEFAFDDHSLWPRSLPEALVSRWRGLSSGGQGMGFGSRGSRSPADAEEQEGYGGSLYDFRRYLRRFTLPREEMEIDQESFDYLFYNLGMEYYGNMPLLEPLEYKEVWRLDALAIAIDTSGSCDAALVSRFLKETYGIFSSRENFFQKMKVVFFQCDCCLQDTAIITSREQWEAYADSLKTKGRGGTDFTPVFREILRLRQSGIIPRPRALLYFTDGDGIYPHRPDYETVFVLAGPKRHPELVPKWAKTLELE